ASSVLAQSSLDAVSASPSATGVRGVYAGTGALTGSREGIESAPTERVTDETAPPETDRTVLVPGLRRAREQVQAHRDPPSVGTIGAPSVATIAPGGGPKSPRRPAFVRGSILAASVVAVAV